MADTYQAIYDATRSRISNGDVGQAVSEAAREGFSSVSWAVEAVKQEFLNVAHEQQRPSVLFRPALSQDGNAWLVIYGDLPTGVVGVGDTPAEAMLDFDRAWRSPAKVPPSRKKDHPHG